ncbi:MAG: LacI family transcriptional regulator [Firmicutes bacterium]|nr:LacI family transcriptional regulator [Bacillota bacterium]
MTRLPKKLPNPQNGNPTIYDVARLAGVSPATVSRALNDTGYVSEETREKILLALEELEFTPNQAARTLKTKRTQQIMLALPDLDNPFYFDMVRSVQEVAKKEGYLMVLTYTGGDEREEIKILQAMRQESVDGLFMVPLNPTEALLAEIENTTTPVVIGSMSTFPWGDTNVPFDYVGVNTQEGLYLATEHVITQGHRRIGFVGGIRAMYSFRERFKGYRQALEDHGLSPTKELLYWSTYTEQGGYEAGLFFASLNPPPTAIVAVNDLLAVGVLQALEEVGIRVPEDISLVGMDNTDLSRRVRPRLTTVALGQAEIGRVGTHFLFDRIKARNTQKQPTVERVVFQPRLVQRDSVKDLK